MRLALLWLATSLALAGCASPDVETASLADAPAAHESEGWTLEAEGTMGWIAAAGAHVFAGDLIVGLRSHEQCPEVSFFVPANASLLRIGLDAGLGPATVAISGPEGVAYLTEPLESAAAHEEERPAAGVWTVEIKPLGALVQDRRALVVGIDGNGTAPEEPLLLQPDADCLA